MTLERDWYTTAEAAKELGLSPHTVREAVHRGRLQAEMVTPRLRAIRREELERYRQEQQGQRGWRQRKADGYQPGKEAEYARSYRARKKVEQASNETRGEE